MRFKAILQHLKASGLQFSGSNLKEIVATTKFFNLTLINNLLVFKKMIKISFV